jgi:hypothetical protein
VLPVPAARLDPLPAVQYLVEAALRTSNRTPHVPASATGVAASAQGNFYERTLWVIELFERVAERKRAGLQGRLQTTGGQSLAGE